MGNIENAGFTTGTPWAKINENYAEINAEDELKNPESVLRFYQKTLKIRKEYADVVRDGAYIPVNLKDSQVFSYIRENGKQKLFVVCSLSPKAVKFKTHMDFGDARVVLSNIPNLPKPSETMDLPPCACALYELL